jgi:hypothetical protein
VFIDRSLRPEDVPEPPSPDAVARAFPGAVLGLVEQGTVEELAAGTGSQESNGSTIMQFVTLSYTLWRNPADRSDPVNLAELDHDLARQLDEQPPWPLPDWMWRVRESMRHPALWEAVRTTHIQDAGVAAVHTPERALVEHVNYILMNTFRAERVHGPFPGELLGRVTEQSVEHGIPVSVDGSDVSGVRVDTDAHVLGLAADLGDRILTAVIAREHLEFVHLAFRTRPASAPAADTARQ